MYIYIYIYIYISTQHTSMHTFKNIQKLVNSVYRSKSFKIVSNSITTIMVIS